MAAVSREVAALGGQAMLIPLGASTPVGALGYVRAAREFVGQLVETETGERRPTTIFMASSSCGTLAGLALGLRLMDRPDIRVVPVSADVSEERIRDETPTSPSTTVRMLRGDVETILLKALEKDRSRRYRSAGALLAVAAMLRAFPVLALLGTCLPAA